MSRIKTSSSKYFREFRGYSTRRSGKRDASVSGPPITSKRLRTSSSGTVFHLTVETEDMNVLDRIRAALPEAARLHVRFVSAGNLRSHSLTQPDADDSASGLPDLTIRQRDILVFLMDGLSNKEIGRKLSLSHFTVRNHISQILRLLNLTSRKDIIARLAELDFGAHHCPPPSGDGFTAK